MGWMSRGGSPTPIVTLGLDPRVHPCRDEFMPGNVYMLTNRKHGALYIGVTANLLARLHKHRTDPEGFVRRHGTNRLVWYESHERIEDAI
ncbi:MAG: hypothetical protein Rhims3KO_30650 [Hyphomicrobiales bacterium]